MPDIAGQVGVVTKNPGWYGRCVQWFTKSAAYHTVTAISETECVSAETPVVVRRPITDFAGIQWTHEPFTPAQTHDIVQFVTAQVGKPYAYFDIVLLAIATITKHHTPWWIVRRLTDDRQWFCSELCDAGMEAGGRNLFPGRPAMAVIPKDFLTTIKGERTTV